MKVTTRQINTDQTKMNKMYSEKKNQIDNENKPKIYNMKKQKSNN